MVADMEKGGEVGADVLSGCVLEPRAMDELLPDWRQLAAKHKPGLIEHTTGWPLNRKTYGGVALPIVVRLRCGPGLQQPVAVPEDAAPHRGRVPVDPQNRMIDEAVAGKARRVLAAAGR